LRTKYPADKRANVRRLTRDNEFVFQSADAKAQNLPPSPRRPLAGFFMRGICGPPHAFRPVKAFAQTMPSGLPGV
jgi:hypothetical protein